MNKEELREIIYLDDLINSKLRQIENLRASRFSIGSISFKPDKVQKTDFRNHQEELIVKLIDLEDDITKDIDRLVDMKTLAKISIDKLNGPYRLVMSMRYLECMKWKEIAYRLNYSVQAVYKIHGQALKMVE